MNHDNSATRRISRRWFVLPLAGAALGLLAWPFLRGSEEERVETAVPVVGVAPALHGDMPVTLSAIGTVSPIVTATVRTQIAGTIFSIDFREGETVREGQRLAQIDPRPYELQLAQAQGALARDTAQLGAARTDLERYRRLLEQDSIARQQVDTQAATVRQLEGTVAADQAAVGTARLNLAYTRITAPVAGTAGLRQSDIGNYVTPGDANGIVVITRTDPVDVSFAVPQDQIPAIRQHQSRGDLPVFARDQGGGRTLATGRFLTLDNRIDTGTGTVRAKARFANAAGALFPNQFVNVTVRVGTLRGVVTVPLSAVRHGETGDFLFVLKPDSTVKLQPVRLGPSGAGRVAVLGGLAAGSQVVIAGADDLDDGASVHVPATAARAR